MVKKSSYPPKSSLISCKEGKASKASLRLNNVWFFRLVQLWEKSELEGRLIYCWKLSLIFCNEESFLSPWERWKTASSFTFSTPSALNNRIIERKFCHFRTHEALQNSNQGFLIKQASGDFHEGPKIRYLQTLGRFLKIREKISRRRFN